MRYTIRSDNKISYNLCEMDEVQSILQNLFLIITTRKGTIPMYREFGIAMNFIDKPIPVAQAIATTEVREAVDEFESRASFIGLSFEIKENVPGGMVMILEVEI